MRLQRCFPRLALVLLAAAIAGCDRQPELATAPTARAGGGLAPLMSAGADAIPGRYVVVLHPRVASASAAAGELVPAGGGEVHFSYEHALKGFAATLAPAALEQLRHDARVAYVIPDVPGTLSAASWGLDRIDERDRPLDGLYAPASTGAGVRVYVIDSGIRTTHAEFGGRASVGVDLVNDGQEGQDCNGHGTHVAGIIAGATFGVARAAQVVAVRVSGCTGDPTASSILAGVDWVAGNAVKPAVVNVSQAVPEFAPLDEAVLASINSGLVYVVAAGNGGQDACNVSPARVPRAITVGASTAADQRLGNTNGGTCLDLFAPGEQITSAWHSSNSVSHTMSGTSAAAPHVAGAAALFLQDEPGATPDTVAARIRTSSTGGRLTYIGSGSPNRLLSAFAAPLRLDPVTAVRPAATTVVLAWRDAGSRETEYAVERGVYRVSGFSGYRRVATLPANDTSYTDTQLADDSTYVYRVAGCNLLGCSAWTYSVPVRAVPRVPSDFDAQPVSATTAWITWADSGAAEWFILTRGVMSLDGTSWGPYADTVRPAGSQRVYKDLELASGRAYRYRIRACNKTSCSGWTDPQSVVMPVPPQSPTGFAAIAATRTQIQLAWTNPTSNATRFVLRRAMRTASGAWGPMHNFPELPAGTASYTDDVMPGQTYLYRLTACNPAGCAPTVVSRSIHTPP